MPLRFAWTPELDRELLARRAAQASWDEIARALRVGRNTVIDRARRLGIRKRGTWPPQCLAPMPEADAEPMDRRPRPPGHPDSWGAITRGTALEGAAYPYPVFDL